MQKKAAVKLLIPKVNCNIPENFRELERQGVSKAHSLNQGHGILIRAHKILIFGHKAGLLLNSKHTSSIV